MILEKNRNFNILKFMLELLRGNVRGTQRKTRWRRVLYNVTSTDVTMVITVS